MIENMCVNDALVDCMKDAELHFRLTENLNPTEEQIGHAFGSFFRIHLGRFPDPVLDKRYYEMARLPIIHKLLRKTLQHKERVSDKCWKEELTK